ncbi:hypothetical protein GQ54DRAFT_319992 [Martensiomyces pterosporus]|nr:hypothetical protein GQ54DRAFT_319992 [Martensiomyces pterosporus]
MKYITIAALALSATTQLASGYSITGADVVNCRSGPGTSSSVVKTYKSGDNVSITCQTAGEAIRGDSLWDKTQDGCYVADYYVKTGTSNYVAAKCGGGSTPPPPPPSNGGGSSNGACKKLNQAGKAVFEDGVWKSFTSSLRRLTRPGIILLLARRH